MAGEMEQLTDQAQQALGDLTGDDDLKARGHDDPQAGQAKERVDDAAKKVGEVIEKAEGQVDKVIDGAKEGGHQR
jgi:uncharacterized protein YjbJ (UPF0337 family)